MKNPIPEQEEVYVPEDALVAQVARNLHISQEQARNMLINSYADDTPGCREVDQEGHIISRHHQILTESKF